MVIFNKEAHQNYLNNIYIYKKDYTIKILEQSGFKKV